MVWHGFLAKATPTVVTGVVGAVAYEAVRKAVAKAPLRKATVTVTAWGLRAVRAAERTAGASAEQIRLTVADVMAEAEEHAAQGVPPLTVAGDHDH